MRRSKFSEELDGAIAREAMALSHLATVPETAILRADSARSMEMVLFM